MTIAAKYEDGVFRPLETVTIKEGAIVQVRVPPEGETPSKRPSIKDLAFYRMWADREDIPDGVTYVNRLREPRF